MQEQALKDRDGRMASAREFASMLRDLNALPKPVIARVQGPAFGGGVGLMSVSDIVIASDKAQFALSETRLGMIPATIGPYVLRRIGEAAARRFILNSRTIDAAAARHIGLVSVIASEDALDRAVETEVNECLRCAPGAVADAKALLRHLACDPAAEQLAWTAERLADRWETNEAQEGIRCLLARQSPSWTRA
jgi:methylglutaconyl-CoA hydratase